MFIVMCQFVIVCVVGMELKDNILVSGNADSTVKIWDIITGQCLQTLSGSKCYKLIIVQC